MNPHTAPKEYLRVKIQTADRTELLLLLVDGAVRFASQAAAHLSRGEFEQKNTLFIKAQSIVLELMQALNPTVGPELYGRLMGLYRFCYERLVTANLKGDGAAAQEALRILEHLRDTWRQAVAKYHEERAPRVPARESTGLCVDG